MNSLGLETGNAPPKPRGLTGWQWIAIIAIIVALVIFGREVLYADWSESSSGCGAIELQEGPSLDICMD